MVGVVQQYESRNGRSGAVLEGYAVTVLCHRGDGQMVFGGEFGSVHIQGLCENVCSRFKGEGEAIWETICSWAMNYSYPTFL